MLSINLDANTFPYSMQHLLYAIHMCLHAYAVPGSDDMNCADTTTSLACRHS